MSPNWLIRCNLAQPTSATSVLPGRCEKASPNRLGIDTRVYLGSAELAAMCALAGRIVTKEEYMEQIKVVNAKAAEIYRYMNFDQIPAFTEVADTVEM